MGTSEPAAKRVRFMDSEVKIDFSDPTTHHDRVLLVDGQKFHVQSSLLSQFSEFFNGLFNSNFKEKNEETIELKDIPAVDFDNFLRALYPIRFKVTVDNLAGLMKLSNRFLCPIVWGLCLKFLKNKEDRKKFSPRELLEWSEGSDSQQLKTLIEQDLIEDKTVYRELGFADLIEFLIFSPNYSPDKLKDLLEEFIFTDPQRKTRYGLVDLLYYCEKYDLTKVRKHLDGLFCRLRLDGPSQVHIVLIIIKICRLPELEVKFFEYMLQLANNINEDKKFPLLEPANYCDIELLKDLAVDYLRDMYGKIDKTQVVVGNFLQISLHYNVVQLQKHVESNLVNDFFNKKGLKYMNLAVKYNLQELKDLIADYLSGTNSSELSDEDKQIILNATPEAKDFVLSIIFKC